MGLRFNPPPNWPPPPPGFVPPPRWQPDPAWPPPPPGWQLWVPDDTVPAGPADSPGGPGGAGDFGTGASGFGAGAVGFGAAASGFGTGASGFGAGAGSPAEGQGDAGAGSGNFATGPHDFATGPHDFAAGSGDYAGRPGDFGGAPGDFGAGAPTALDPLDPRGGYPGDPSGGPGGPGPQSGRTNGFAIAAFILGLLGGTLLSLIFGVVALSQIRNSQQRGKGLAIAGIVLSVIWGGVLAFFLLGSSSPSKSTPPSAGGGTPAASPSAAPTGGGTGSSGTGGSTAGGGTNSQTSVFALRAGQCFQNPPASQEVLGITSVTVVPCTTPHNAQVFVEFNAKGSSYPGSSALKRQADQGCHARITGNVKSSKITNSMTLRFLYPLANSWAEGHRTITCLIVDAKPDLKSSLLRAHPKG